MTMPVLDLFRLDGRHALIAGAAGLLGPVFAEALLEAGARLSLLDINRDQLSSCAAALRRRFGTKRVLPLACDLTDEHQVEGAVRSAERAGPIRILVNAAAIDPKVNGPAALHPQFTDYSVALWRQSMDVNLTGTFLMTQAVCRRMERRSSGVIVTLSSIYGLVGPDQRVYHEGRSGPAFVKPGDYSAAKAGIIGFTRYLAAYYAGHGIRVNCLTPGGVQHRQDRAFRRAYSARTLVGRMARREEYKGAIVFLCSDASSYMTGANLVMDGGWTAM